MAGNDNTDEPRAPRDGDAGPSEQTTSGPTEGDILPPSHWAAAQEDDDQDSALGDDDSSLLSSTASLSSSIFRYRTLHGRTYHSERGNAQYWCVARAVSCGPQTCR